MRKILPSDVYEGWVKVLGMDNVHALEEAGVKVNSIQINHPWLTVEVRTTLKAMKRFDDAQRYMTMRCLRQMGDAPKPKQSRRRRRRVLQL